MKTYIPYSSSNSFHIGTVFYNGENITLCHHNYGTWAIKSFNDIYSLAYNMVYKNEKFGYLLAQTPGEINSGDIFFKENLKKDNEMFFRPLNKDEMSLFFTMEELEILIIKHILLS